MLARQPVFSCIDPLLCSFNWLERYRAVRACKPCVVSGKVLDNGT